MDLYNLKNKKLTQVESKPFNLEKDIQTIIEENTQAMSIGEERTIIATYEYVFGDAPSGNIPQDSFIIFELILISAKDK